MGLSLLGLLVPFEAPAQILVDDFESYPDTATLQAAWLPGLGFPTPSLETAIVAEGALAMRLDYVLSAGQRAQNVEFCLPEVIDLQTGTLSALVRGSPTNSPDDRIALSFDFLPGGAFPSGGNCGRAFIGLAQQTVYSTITLDVPVSCPSPKGGAYRVRVGVSNFAGTEGPGTFYVDLLSASGSITSDASLCTPFLPPPPPVPTLGGPWILVLALSLGLAGLGRAAAR